MRPPPTAVMLSRTAASRRALPALRLANRHLPITRLPTGLARSISIWPFRKKPDPALPVYFPTLASRLRKLVPWRKLRYVIFCLAVYYVLAFTFVQVVLSPLFDWVDAEWDSLSETEKQQLEDEADEEDDVILFLPVPFTSYTEKPGPYRRSDPEWKVFRDIATDPRRQEEIKAQLVKTLAASLGRQNPRVKNIKAGNMSLDLIYPPTPPPEHYIQGIIVDEEGIFWGARSMDSHAANTLNFIAYPTTAALATWAAISSLAGDWSRDIIGVFSKKQEPTSWESALLAPPGKRPEGSLTGAGPPPLPRPSHPALKNGKDAGALPNDGNKPFVFALLPNGQIQSNNQQKLSRAVAAGLTVYLNNWKRKTAPTLNRGTVIVEGHVEFTFRQTERAVIIISAAYDPQLRRFTAIQAQSKQPSLRFQKPSPPSPPPPPESEAGS